MCLLPSGVKAGECLPKKSSKSCLDIVLSQNTSNLMDAGDKDLQTDRTAGLSSFRLPALRNAARSIMKLLDVAFIGPLLLKKEDIFTERTSTISAQGETNGHQWVDLGLPSGTKWATCNIDASSSEELGETFAWAEVIPASDKTSPKNDVYDKELMEIGYF